MQNYKHGDCGLTGWAWSKVCICMWKMEDCAAVEEEEENEEENEEEEEEEDYHTSTDPVCFELSWFWPKALHTAARVISDSTSVCLSGVVD